jgi:hypothetical protein
MSGRVFFCQKKKGAFYALQIGSSALNGAKNQIPYAPCTLVQGYFYQIKRGKNTMKKLLGKFQTKTNKAYILCEKAKRGLLDTRGDGYIDTAVKIIIGVVIGALVLAGLVLLWNSVIMPRLNNEVVEMFG